MAGTNAYAAKQSLVDGLKGLPALSGVKELTVAYSWSGQLSDSNREVICFGPRIGGPMALAAMASGGRVLRSEDPTTELHIIVYQPDAADAAPVEARAVQLGTAVEEYIAGNSLLGGVPGLLKAVIASFDMTSADHDEGWSTDLTYMIQFSSHIR